MATLAVLRGYLNDELGVTSDAETSPFSQTLRNRAISSGYAALWRQGVWKPVEVDITTVQDQVFYTATGISRLGACYVLDSDDNVIERLPATLEERSGGNILIIPPLAASYTLRLEGWTAYKSTFSGDADTDDIPAEMNRVPLLKAKAICYRKALGDYARYGTRQAAPPEMNVTPDQLLAIVAAAEREFEAECRAIAVSRRRYGKPLHTGL